MGFIYYNPQTMEHPHTALHNVRPVDLSDRFVIAKLRHGLLKPYESREAALDEQSSCNVTFYEDGILYEAVRIPEWMYQPCIGIACNPGINWHTYYAPTVEQLRKNLLAKYGELVDFTPVLNKYGLYEIQVHYDGKCR